MEIVRLSKRGRLSLPRALLERMKKKDQELLLVDIAPDGSIILIPIGVGPLEIYTDRRLGEFLDEDRLSSREVHQLRNPRRRAKS